MIDQSLTPTPEQRKMLEQLVGRELKSGEPLWPIVFAALDAIGQHLVALGAIVPDGREHGAGGQDG